MFNFPLPENELEGQRQAMLARQQRVERGRQEVERAWGNALERDNNNNRNVMNTPNHRQQRPSPHQTFSPPQQHRQHSNASSSPAPAVSRRELLAQREQQAYQSWTHGSPPAQQSSRGGAVNTRLEEEIQAERMRVREQMIERNNARQGAAEQRQNREERALRDQQQRTQQSMQTRIQQHEAMRQQRHQQHQGPHTPPPQRSTPSPSSAQGPRRQSAGTDRGSLAELVEAQMRMEEEERLILNEARRYQAPTTTSDPSSAQARSTPPPPSSSTTTPNRITSPPHQLPPTTSPPPAQVTGTYEDMVRMRDAHTFSPHGGGAELHARGMSRRAAGTTLAQQRRGVGMGTAMNIFGVSQPVPAEAVRTTNGGGRGGGGGGGANAEWEINDFSYEALLDLGSMAVATGLDKRQLERYKPVLLTKSNQQQLLSASGRSTTTKGSSPQPVNIGDTDDCSICLEPMEEGERVLTIQCKHLFHYPCIIQWLARTNKCPVCRFEIPRKEKIVHYPIQNTQQTSSSSSSTGHLTVCIHCYPL